MQTKLSDLSLQDKLRNRSGLIKIQCTYIEAKRWYDFLEYAKTKVRCRK